jgi:predicted nuclease of predicted toxin-antitoxin system
MAKFIVDESAGTAVIEYLRSVGHDALAVAEAMPQADDPDILAQAVSEGRILVTNDKDFGELVFRGGQAHHGVLLLRLHDESPINRVSVVEAVLEQYADRLAGCFTVATEGSVRIRPASEPL